MVLFGIYRVFVGLPGKGKAAEVTLELGPVTAVAPIVFGHVENTDTLVFYRQGARDQVFFGGDLVAYRASANGGANPHYLGVFEAR